MGPRGCVMQGWRLYVMAGVCVAALLLWLLLGLEKQQPDPRPTALPQGRFVRSVGGDIQRRPRSELRTQPPRVLCLVVTSPQYHQGRARHLRATWGKEGSGACPNTVFLTTAPDDILQNVIISNFSRYEDLWGKVLEGLMSLNTSAADWFLKADDDTFLIYPHLLSLLAPLDPSKALYLGLPLVYRPEGGEEVTYMSGGAGYVLSRAALVRLQAAHAPARCRNPGHTRYEDVNMGYCMADLGVREVDTRDALNRPRFLPYPPWRLLQPHPSPDLTWLTNFSKYKFHFGAQSLSDRVVSFHEIRDPVDFYLLQYLVYDLRLLPQGSSRPFTPSKTPPQ
ncbi:Glycoprotein-N-acetylgalactosamine 3-beta-galactosyltransferase 1 [Chionoecetes opilio]|uniref:N-acetylgalactosaminide beta-1,3-galactosyltransferase n=1 Tax=Chionoecetes opilio TaxID=41210 RepID=A0A8J5CW90_CHIOP|nr:Glycoprotein-N-acetylgalactosamine 3-beta-galactosyltransferase 1 [Chionoecetes opilio]